MRIALKFMVFDQLRSRSVSARLVVRPSVGQKFMTADAAQDDFFAVDEVANTVAEGDGAETNQVGHRVNHRAVCVEQLHRQRI